VQCRIVVTTTLNDNLLRAKLEPLVDARRDIEVIVVTDREGPVIERVRWVYPRGPAAALGRLGGRLVLLLVSIARKRTDLVMAYGLVPHGLFAVALARLLRCPVWLHYIAGSAEIRFAHDTDVSDNRVIAASRRPERLEWVARRVGRAADRVFVPGSRTAAFLDEEGYAAERVEPLHSTVDIRRFHPTPDERVFDVLVCAQLRARKRPRFTLEVLAAIRRRHPGARFCWLGDGSMRGEFERMLDELGIRSAVTWTATSAVEHYYRRARTFLLCSINEGLSLATLEAMACGVVPVVSDVGDMADVVHPRETGALLPVDVPVEAYADAVLKFLQDEALWSRCSAASVDLIRNRHSYDVAMAAWQRLLPPSAST